MNFPLTLIAVIAGTALCPAQIRREVKPFEPMKIQRITIEAGATAPIRILHISDTHLTEVDSRDGELKQRLGAHRAEIFPMAGHYLEEALSMARDSSFLLIHTGDMIDFVSEANLDAAARQFSRFPDMIATAGNHEYSEYVGEAREDEAYKQRNFDHVGQAFPNSLGLYARTISGIRFVAVDDIYYYFTPEVAEGIKKEFALGLPVVLLMHVPLYTPRMCEDMLKDNDGKCAYLTGVPRSITEHYDPNFDATKHELWRSREVQQRADDTTLELTEWLRSQPLLKAILCGHTHTPYTDRFSPTAIQYTVGSNADGFANIIEIK